MIRTLTFTTLFPNAAMPTFGIFVETRLRHLVASGQVRTQVMAPVPWFPLPWRLFGSYGAYARAPRAEQRHGLSVTHPRFVALPKIGRDLVPAALYRTCRPLLERMIAAGDDFDLIDAHYLYPDGVAAARLGAALGKPVVITARGTDVNVMPGFAKPRRLILQAARQAAAIVTVSEALRRALIDLGVDGGKIVTLRNGVDLERFQPRDRTAARDALGVTGPLVVSVGNLVGLKGHDLIIRALADVADATLLIAGDGGERSALSSLARASGVADRVRLVGRLPQETLADLYSAADALVLASSREGWPNVLLEAMACGTPVAATRVGGVPEIVTKPEAGVLIDERTPGGIAAALRTLLADPPRRQATRRYAEGFGWAATTRGQLALFREILETGRYGP